MKMANLEISVTCSNSCYQGQNEEEAAAHRHNNNKEIKEEEEKEEIQQEGIIVLSKQRHQVESRKDQEEHQEIDEDGFKTPTSMDQRIPTASKQCPPAPRKPKPPLLPLKRKQPCSLSSPSPSSCCIVSCRYHPLDLSREVDQLLFPQQKQQHHHQLLSSDQIIISKKIRREEETTL
ncbi:hypothetical protein PIB30_014638 [Stylosanthes scabra]|uniref:Uncharacterized protein n=1 Tax=Stylosanthes scabra TaxID=79078 RepID=A0ABU6S735_9FABA|nr:hypothetical protein [Stylosanthes scabra]